MTERTTAERPIRGSLAFSRRVRPWYLIAIVAGAAAVVLLARLVQPPSTIDRLTVKNPTKFDVAVAVDGGGDEGWMPVGSVRRASTATFEDVVDQGGTWRFQLSAQGKDGGEVQISKADLEKAGWHFEIPESVSDKLLSEGAEFPP
jgi:hypothetical protein